MNDRGSQLMTLRLCVLPDVIIGKMAVGSGVLKSVLRCIDDHIDHEQPIGEKQCWAAAETIAAECGWSERTTRRAIQGLAQLGAIAITPRPGRTPLMRINWPWLASLPTIQTGRNPGNSCTPVTVAPLQQSPGGPVTVAGHPGNSCTQNEKETKKKRKSARTLIFTPQDRETAEWFWAQVRLVTGTDSKPPNFDRWADSIRKIREDGQSPRPDGEIRAALLAAHADRFWQKNILSPDKLRKQWITISAIRQAASESKSNDPAHKPWRGGSYHANH